MKPANHGIKHRLTSCSGLPIAEGYPMLDPNFPKPARITSLIDTRALLITIPDGVFHGNRFSNSIFVVTSDTITLLY
jgi:hypothetical protein